MSIVKFLKQIIIFNKNLFIAINQTIFIKIRKQKSKIKKVNEWNKCDKELKRIIEFNAILISFCQ